MNREPCWSTLESSPDAVVVVDASGTIVYVNAETERLFGYAKDELVGQSVDDLLLDDVGSLAVQFRMIDARATDARPMWTGQAVTGRRKDGALLAIEVGFSPLKGHPSLVVASIVDITHRLRSEESRRATLEDQLGFEHLLAQFSLQCLNLPEDQMSPVIRQVLGKLGTWLSIDRCSFFRIAPDDRIFDPVLWLTPGTEAVDAPLAGGELFPWALSELRAGRNVSFTDRDELPDERDRAGFARLGVRAGLYVPLWADGRVSGGLGFAALRTSRTWPAEVVHRIEVVASVVSQVLARIEHDESLRSAHAEVQRLKEQLHAENVYLRRDERERLRLTRIIGQSPAIERVMRQIQQVASTDSTALLLGETGTGKELLANQIHELSARHGRPMVRVNCGAIPATLIESELFGREKGAFTGALARQVGRFELADHSTIFLDEIGELPHDVQVKLLRVLEERTIERLGSPRPITVNTRIITATNRDLEQRVQEGTFRDDLYYRLNVFPIHVPPLRERTEDIPLLVWRFVEEFSRAFGKRVDSIDKTSLAALQQYHWPGNIRELRNTVERAMIVTASRRLTIALPASATTPPRRSTKLADVERDHIRRVLESARWRIRGPAGAAERLGLKPTTLETRMMKLGIRRPKVP